MTKPRIAFFGTSPFSVYVLEELMAADLSPAIIVTAPDKPQGRHLAVAPNEVKTWALQKGLPIFETTKLDTAAYDKLSKTPWDIFVVASYGSIVPERFIELPKHKTLNVHPSLLPDLRGPSPLQYAILEDKKDTGVSIMLIDKEVDHGPILAQENTHIDEWPPYKEFEKMLGKIGGKLLAATIPDWISGKITPIEQDHAQATYTKKITKEDGLLDLATDPYLNFRKIQAFSEWPGAYFFTERAGKRIRVIVKKSSYKNNTLTIERVVPEGKKEMPYEDFLRGNKEK